MLSLTERFWYKILDKFIKVWTEPWSPAVLRIILRIRMKQSSIIISRNQQGQIHDNPVADGWAGAVMQKTLWIQKCDVTYQPTRQSVVSRVRD